MSKTAFVLSGGGAKGSFEFGVLKKLVASGIKPDAIYGTSTGALNSLGYTYMGIEKMEQIWRGIKTPKDVLFPIGWQWIYAWPRLFFSTGMYSTKPLQKLLTKNVTGEPQCEGICCWVDLVSGETKYHNSKDGTVKDAIDGTISSASIPMFMDTYGMNVDGGVREQTPLSKAIDDGCDVIYLILANPWVQNPVGGWKLSGFKIFNVGMRAINDIMDHEVFINDINACLRYNKHIEYFSQFGKKEIELHLYAPKEQVMDTFDFYADKIARAIDIGLATEETDLG